MACATQPATASKLERALAGTGVRLSRLGFGAWAIGGSSSVWGYGPTDDGRSRAAIRAALSHGCTLFDTADCYGAGHSEQLLGTELAGHRHQVLIATKVGIDFYAGPPRANFDPAYLRFALHQSLRRLQTDHVDLLQLHNPPPWLLGQAELIDELRRLRQQGKALALGVSAATVADGVTALTHDWIDSVQVPYSMLLADAERELLPLAAAAGVGVIVREALANGMLVEGNPATRHFPVGDIRSLWPAEMLRWMCQATEDLRRYRRPGETMAQLALRFALEPPQVTAVLCGCKTPEQVAESFQLLGCSEQQPDRHTAEQASSREEPGQTAISDRSENGRLEQERKVP